MRLHNNNNGMLLLLTVVALLLSTFRANAETFQSRQLLQVDLQVFGEADSSVVASGAGAGGASLTIGTSAGTDASDTVDPLSGISTEVANAGAGGNAVIYADETYGDSLSSAYTMVDNEDRGVSDVNGFVEVSSEGAAAGEDYVMTNAGANVVYQEGPDFGYDVLGDFGSAASFGSAGGYAGGDAITASVVELDVSIDVIEEANDVESSGQFGYALGEVLVESLTEGVAESDYSGADTTSSAISYAETSAAAAPGIAAADAYHSLSGITASTGDVVAENTFTGYGESLSFATDNTLAPGVGIPVANAEDAKAITQTGVTITGLSEDEFVSTISSGTLYSNTYVLAETGVEYGIIDGIEAAAGQADATAGANFGAYGSANGATAEGTMSDADIAGYLYAATEGRQNAQGESYVEAMGELYHQGEASALGSGGVTAYGGGDVMSESNTGYTNIFGGLLQMEFADSMASGTGGATAQANGDEVATSTAGEGLFQDDVYHFKYTEDGLTGAGSMVVGLSEFDYMSEASGEGLASSTAEGAGSAEGNTYAFDGFGVYENVADSDLGANILAIGSGDMTDARGQSYLGSANVNGATFFQGPSQPLGATAAFADIDVDGSSNAFGAGVSAVSIEAGESTSTDSGNAIPTESNAVAQGGVDIATVGDFITTGGGIGTQAYSGTVGGLSSSALPNEYSAEFGAGIIGAQAVGGLGIGGFAEASGEHEFSVGAYSDAGTLIRPDRWFTPDRMEGGIVSSASGYTNHEASLSGGFGGGGAQAGLTLGTATGAADLEEDEYGNYAVGLGVSEGSLQGLASAQGMASEGIDIAAGASGNTGTLTGANNNGVGAADAIATGHGELSTYSDAEGAGFGFVQSSTLSSGMLRGEAAGSVDGSGSAGEFESSTITMVSNMGMGEDPTALSTTSAMIGGEVVSYADPEFQGLGTVITDVVGVSAGYAEASPVAGVQGYTNSDSTSEILDSAACEEDPECSVVDGGFAAASGFGGGNAATGVFARPAQFADIDDQSLTAGVETFVQTVAVGNAAALAVEENSLGGGYSAAQANNVQLLDVEGQLKPGVLGFGSVRSIELEGEGYYDDAVAAGEMIVIDTLNAEQDSEITSTSDVGFLPRSIAVSTEGFAESFADFGVFVGNIPEDELLYGVELSASGDAAGEAFAYTSFQGSEEVQGGFFSPPMFQFVSTLDPLEP
jgi:hypothetical protein